MHTFFNIGGPHTTQKEESLLFQFLMAQKHEPRRGDFYSAIQKYLTEFEIHLSEENIKEMPEKLFKSLVKKQAKSVAIQYLKKKQSDGDKGSEIEYQDFGLQDYLSPSANIKLEDQHILFSLRSRMYPLKINFSRNGNIKEELCISSCKQIIDNEHLTWCDKLNSKNDFRYSHILNGNLEEKIKTLEQIKSNEKRRNKEKSSLVIQ